MTNYKERFVSVLLEASENKTDYYTAVDEWVYFGETYEDESTCICGHWIVQNCVVHNTRNNNTLILGNCCINKIGIKRRHANKSKLNYMALCLEKASSQREINFVKNISDSLCKYKSMKLTIKQARWLESISGMKYRWKLRDHSLEVVK